MRLMRWVTQLYTCAAQSKLLVYNWEYSTTYLAMEVIQTPIARIGRAHQNHSQNNASFERFVAYVARLHQARSWYYGGIAGASLAHKVVRTLLWDLLAEDTLLFQAAIFVSGTFSNTCGIPKEQLVHMAPALAVMRGSSMRALREAAFTTEQTSYKTAAIALLAGWEKRFGDTESADVHMQAWRALPLPEHALDEEYVLALLDVTFQVFQDSLIEHVAFEDDENETPSSSSSSFLAPPIREASPTLPAGFSGYFHPWPESQSLRALLSQLTQYNFTTPTSVSQIRQLCIEFLAWSPSHSQNLTPVPEYESQFHPLELKILYHIRAACVSISAMYLRLASDYHHVQWIADVEEAVHAHTMSCHHLPTNALMMPHPPHPHGGNDTANISPPHHDHIPIALWSRWIMCVAARDPASDDLLRELISRAEGGGGGGGRGGAEGGGGGRGSGIRKWKDLENLFKKRFLLPEFLVERSRELYGILFVDDGGGVVES